MWARLFLRGNRTPCFTEKGFICSELGNPELGVSLKGGFMTGGHQFLSFNNSNACWAKVTWRDILSECRIIFWD